MKRSTVILLLLPLGLLLVPTDWRPHFRMPERVGAVFDWLVPAMIGVLFTLLGLLKLYGMRCGIEGGRDKTLGRQLCGTCPNWKYPAMRIVMPAVFLLIGLGNLAWFAWEFYSRGGR